MKVAHLEEQLTDVDEASLVRVVYASYPTLASRLSGYIIEDIQKQAIANNQSNEITGVLCYGDGCFLQCIEGQKKAILALMRNIFADRRHKKVTVLLTEQIEARSFFGWQMQTVALDARLWTGNSIQAQSKELQAFLPFTPEDWSQSHLQLFLQLLEKFDRLEYRGHAALTVNELGNIPGHAISQHQAFFIVQAIFVLISIPVLVFFYMFDAK